MNQDQEGVVALEDRLAGDLLDRLNQVVLSDPVASDDGSEALLRSYLEVVGLLPYELDPVDPSPATKARLMASLRGEAENGSAGRRKEVTVLSSRTESGGWRSWALPLAAGLVLALLGVSGWQRSHMERQQQEIAQLSGHLREVNLQSAELAQYRQELVEAQAKLSVLDASGVEVCSLHPMEARLVDSAPTATLFVAPDHQHWYLRIDDLEPCPLGRSYQLWFVTGDGTAVDGGILQVEHGVELEVTSDSMPKGTVEVNVTLEPAGGSTAPSGPLVLHGNEVMRIL